MRTFFVLLIGIAGAAYLFRERIDRFARLNTWESPDGSSLWEELSTSIQDLYGGDLLGDGRDHSEKIETLEAAGEITFYDPEDTTVDSNNGAILADPANADIGTQQYLAQTECRIAVNEYGMDPSLEAECRADVVRRGRYFFESGGVRMAVDILGGMESGARPNVQTNVDNAEPEYLQYIEVTEG